MKQERIHQVNKFNKSIQYTKHSYLFLCYFGIYFHNSFERATTLFKNQFDFFNSYQIPMYGNIPAHSHHTARQMSVPVQENSYISKSYTSKSKSRLMMSEPEKRIPEKIQYGNTDQNKPSKKQKNKKIDIKKLIEQKQARQNVQKSRQQKVEPKNSQVFKLFQTTDHPHIDRCLYCGYIVFDENQTQRQALKLQHAKREHASYPYVDKRSVETQSNTDQYIKIAQDLIKFANNRDNRQLMEYVFGQSTPEPFKVYTEPIPVKPQLQKWANVVQDVFKVNF